MLANHQHLQDILIIFQGVGLLERSSFAGACSPKGINALFGGTQQTNSVALIGRDLPGRACLASLMNLEALPSNQGVLASEKLDILAHTMIR
jgi:hypothetical protein